MQEFVDFREIKDRITIRSVLDHYNINVRRSNQHSMRGKCPLPTHSSETSSESFSVDTDKNIWACQSSSCATARAGKKGGNIIDFVAVMERCSIREAAIKLNNWFPTSTSSTTSGKGSGKPAELVSKKESDDGDGENAPLAFTLQGIDHAHPYLRNRGINEDVAMHFGVGFFPGKGSMSGRVVIPIHNSDGALVAYAGRAIDASDRRYKVPSGFKKSRELWNFNRVRSLDARRNVVIVVEGFFDCMKVHLVGVPHVVALMGSAMSDHQEKLLAEFRHVILFLDGDDAGRSAAHAIAARLVHKTFVKIVSLDDGVQPDQLTSPEIREILGVKT